MRHVKHGSRQVDIMVRLIPMTATDFQAYLEEDIERYAQERVRAGDWHPSEALQKSREEHQQLLPDGVATKNHYLFSIEDEALGSNVGIIWFAIYDKQLRPVAFVYDFLIYEEFQRRGYGKQAMLALEAKVKDLNVDKIALQVFAHNHVARALYEKTGFEITGFYMTKELTR
jgi:RimJ/RimL family protein N-acetyltransferase